MPQPNKIITYGLEERVLQLSAQPGATDISIAAILTQDLAGAGKISPSAVSRFRRAVRAERASETQALIQDHIRGVVPQDLKAIEEIEMWFLSIFRNQAELVQVRDPELLKDPEISRLLSAISASEFPGGFDVKTRGWAAGKVKELIELKLKFSGALDDPNKAAAAAKKADQMLDELDKDLQGAVGDALGAGKDKAPVSGPH